MPDINYTKFIESDVPLSSHDARQEAIHQFEEENAGLLAEEKFGIFLNRNLNKAKNPKKDKKHEIEAAMGMTWKGLERQPQFMCMKISSVVYMILALATNGYIYMFLIVGLGKFKLDRWFYEVI